MTPTSPAGRDIFTVSRLAHEARQVIEGSFPLLWIEGEVSNLSRPASGHLYFSLKDAAAQVRCALFRSTRLRLRAPPRDGMQVLARVRVSFYEPRGEFQLIVEHLEPAGEGALRLAFDVLRRKLEAEGLFAPERKRPLPPFPRRVGLLTSPSGAAIRDLLSVLGRRFPALDVVVYPVPVQGPGAAAEIVRMLAFAARRNECELLILARGGGSLEDLAAFNDEALARAIAACPLPVVCGVGHEIDYTIADLVADHRAATPTAAAERVAPDGPALRRRLADLGQRLAGAIGRRIDAAARHLEHDAQRLAQQQPRRRIEQRMQRVDELGLRLRRALHGQLQVRTRHYEQFAARLRAAGPERRIERAGERVALSAQRLHQGLARRLERDQTRFAALGRALATVNPLATLARGYAIVECWPEGGVVRDSAELSSGDRVRARLARGAAICRVESLE